MLRACQDSYCEMEDAGEQIREWEKNNQMSPSLSRLLEVDLVLRNHPKLGRQESNLYIKGTGGREKCTASKVLAATFRRPVCATSRNR